jgi:hypothetical protein
MREQTAIGGERVTFEPVPLQLPESRRSVGRRVFSGRNPGLDAAAGQNLFQVARSIATGWLRTYHRFHVSRPRQLC